jgi:hypothetical protein
MWPAGLISTDIAPGTTRLSLVQKWNFYTSAGVATCSYVSNFVGASMHTIKVCVHNTILCAIIWMDSA